MADREKLNKRRQLLEKKRTGGKNAQMKMVVETAYKIRLEQRAKILRQHEI